MNLRLRPREFPRTGKCSTSPSCFFRGAIARITISRTTIFRIDDNLVVSIHADLSVREIPTSVGKILAPFELALSLRLAHARVCLHSLTHSLISGHPHECGEARRICSCRRMGCGTRPRDLQYTTPGTFSTPKTHFFRFF